MSSKRSVYFIFFYRYIITCANFAASIRFQDLFFRRTQQLWTLYLLTRLQAIYACAVRTLGYRNFAMLYDVLL